MDDTVLINGVWREIFDVWKDGDNPAAQLGDDSELTKQILDKVDWGSPCWVAVRYVAEEESTEAEVESGLAFLRLRELVQVQKKVPSGGVETASLVQEKN